MSVHRDCGEPIRWARRDDEPSRFMPPLEPAGQAYILSEDGAAVYVTIYQVHNCDPDKMLAWQDYQARLSEIKSRETVTVENMSAWEVAGERGREEAWGNALRFECPTCSQPVGERCRDMSRKYIKTGELVFTKNPHPARLKLATADTSSKDN